MKKYILLIVGLLASSFCSAKGQELFEVKFVGCFLNGTCYIGISPDSTLTGCGYKNQVRFNIQEPSGEAIYSTALTAFAATKKINVYVTDSCVDGFPSLEWISVNND